MQQNIQETTLLPTSRGPQPDLQDAALAFRELFGQHVAYCEADDTWLQWSGTHWRDMQRSKTELDRMAVEALRNCGVPISGSGKVDGVIRLAKALMRREFNESPRLLNFRNGTLEIEHTEGANKPFWSIGKLREHRIEDSLRLCVPYDYAPDQNHSITDDYLTHSIPDPLARECFKAHVGLAMMRDITMHYALVVKGLPRSGKSTLLALANSVCGAQTQQEALSFAPKTLFDEELEGKRSRFAWRNKSIVCVDELPAAALRAESEFKIMSAHGGAGMRGMNKDDETQTIWRAKIIMATNDTPKFKDASGAMKERLVAILMPNYRSEGQRDQGLVEKMSVELGAFAHTCIQAALEAKNRGYYQRSRAMMTVLNQWSEAGNALRAFVNTQAVLGAGSRIPIAEFYTRYAKFVTDQGGSPLTQSNMVAELTDMGMGIDTKKARAAVTNPVTRHSEMKVVHCLSNIKLRSVSEEFEEEALRLDDFRPAITADADTICDVQALTARGIYEAAYQTALGITDNADRAFYLDQLLAIGFTKKHINVAESFQEQESLPLESVPVESKHLKASSILAEAKDLVRAGKFEKARAKIGLFPSEYQTFIQSKIEDMIQKACNSAMAA